MAPQTAEIDPAGGIPEIKVEFGNANVGVYRLFRWDSNRLCTRIGKSVDRPAMALAGVRISYEALIQSPRTGPGQPYAMRVFVRQDGRTVPGGAISQSGKLNADGAKSVIGFISFQLAVSAPNATQ